MIVPVRNDPRRLAECLAHLRRSSFGDWELIVVDDASTDATPDVAREQGASLIRLEARSGPAAARNRGAEAASGEHLVFVDADVCVREDTLQELAAAFSDPTVDAVFGSYDRFPAARQLVSQYKNLLHHFTHQQGAEEAGTFWAGCGAIKRAVFLAMGGFDTSYDRPCIEDIELGARLRRSGHRIVLRKSAQATHLKRWTFAGLLKSDLFDRGVPWTELMLRERHLPDELNLKLSQRASAVLVYTLSVCFLGLALSAPALLLVPPLAVLGLVVLDPWSARAPIRLALGSLSLAAGAATAAIAWSQWGAWATLPGILLIAVGVLNRELYAFFLRERGLAFSLVAVPLQLFYYLYSGAALAIGMLRFAWKRYLVTADR